MDSVAAGFDGLNDDRMAVEKTAELIERLSRSSQRGLRPPFFIGGEILQYPNGLPFAKAIFSLGFSQISQTHRTHTPPR